MPNPMAPQALRPAPIVTITNRAGGAGRQAVIRWRSGESRRTLERRLVASGATVYDVPPPVMADEQGLIVTYSDADTASAVLDVVRAHSGTEPDTR